MHRSHWDLEVHARDFQQNRWREAVRQRLAAEAAGGRAPGGQGNPFHLGVARGVAAMKSWFSAQRSAGERSKAGEAAGVGWTGHAARPTASARLASPYGDMVVIARGSAATMTEQPSGVRDC